MARKYSMAAFAARLKKRPTVKEELLVLGAAEPIGEAVLRPIVHQYSECLSIVAVVSTRYESQRLLQRHRTIRTAVGNTENPAFLENAAQTAKIVINTHASASSAAAIAAAHLVHVLSHNPCTNVFYIHTSSTAMLNPSPVDPPYVAPPRNECAAIAAATTAAVLKVRTNTTKDPRGKAKTVWNDLADIDEICALPMSREHAHVDAAVREAVRASEKRVGKKTKGGRVRLATVAPGVVYGVDSAFGSFEAANKSVDVVHVDDLVQLYLRLVHKAIMGPDGGEGNDDEKRAWVHNEGDWEECWGLHAFYFAVTEHVKREQLEELLGQEDQRAHLGEPREDDSTAGKKYGEGDVELRCCSERAKWILGWVPQHVLGG
ncbi:hypothetical protein HDK77DRAFT_442188 [Phyllosticta capitalensis]|uniref:NAD(P)-binding domain-containing protein n=1 Tax=Phyllosticta capitalensis TaxID=121624 RepID=A0ABR1Z4Q4_9PEZI